MLNTADLKQIKQVNVSVDAEKTKQRVKEIWKLLQKPQREELLNMAGLTKFTVERTYKNGNISARLAATIAQTLRINPYFLIGEADEQQEYSDAILEQFLQRFGYEHLFKPVNKQKRKYTRKQVKDVEEVSAEQIISNIQNGMSQQTENEEKYEAAKIYGSQEEVLLDPSFNLSMFAENLFKTLSDEEKEKFDKITEEDLFQLIKGLALRARFSDNNENIFMLLKYILVR